MRIYFIIVGVLGVLGGIQNVTSEGIGGLLMAISVANLLVAAGILYCGIQLRELLTNKPQVVTGVLIANLILIGIVTALIVNAGGGGRALTWPIIGAAISVYLIVNVNRLSQNLGS